MCKYFWPIRRWLKNWLRRPPSLLYALHNGRKPLFVPLSFACTHDPALSHSDLWINLVRNMNNLSPLESKSPSSDIPSPSSILVELLKQHHHGINQCYHQKYLDDSRREKKRECVVGPDPYLCRLIFKQDFNLITELTIIRNGRANGGREIREVPTMDNLALAMDIILRLEKRAQTLVNTNSFKSFGLAQYSSAHARRDFDEHNVPDTSGSTSGSPPSSMGQGGNPLVSIAFTRSLNALASCLSGAWSPRGVSTSLTICP